MTDTTAPRTAAGRALVAELWTVSSEPGAYAEDIVAIEAEAIEPLLALVRAARWVEKLATSYFGRYGLANTSGERHADRKMRTEDLRGELGELRAILDRLPPELKS